MVWYIPEERVIELEWRCASVARIRIATYFREQNFVEMERMAWWLFRAAAKEQDEVDAAAALTLAGFDPMSKIMLESVGLSKARKDGRLAHAKMKWRQLAKS